MKFPEWVLPSVPIIAAGIVLAALIVHVTKFTLWAASGYLVAGLCLVTAGGGVWLIRVWHSERRRRMRRAREIVDGLIERGKHFQQRPSYQNTAESCGSHSISTLYASPPHSTTPLSYLPAEIETWRSTIGHKLHGQPFKKGADKFVLETTGNRLDPVLDRLRKVRADLDSWVERGD